MTLTIDWLPAWLLRRIVRRNPWLAAQGGTVNRAVRLDLWLFGLTVHGSACLTPRARAKLGLAP